MSAVAIHRAPSDRAPGTHTARQVPIATEMREALGWVAHNLRFLVEDDVSTYETNSLRSQVVHLMALASDVEALEMQIELAERPEARQPTAATGAHRGARAAACEPAGVRGLLRRIVTDAAVYEAASIAEHAEQALALLDEMLPADDVGPVYERRAESAATDQAAEE